MSLFFHVWILLGFADTFSRFLQFNIPPHLSLMNPFISHNALGLVSLRGYSEQHLWIVAVRLCWIDLQNNVDNCSKSIQCYQSLPSESIQFSITYLLQYTTTVINFIFWTWHNKTYMAESQCNVLSMLSGGTAAALTLVWPLRVLEISRGHADFWCGLVVAKKLKAKHVSVRVIQ